jgi:SAM-dependent methyltransferase
MMFMHFATDPQRKESERAFHNERYGGVVDSRESLNKWYAAVGTGARRQIECIEALAEGAKVLEYGCADGRLSLIEEDIARNAEQFFGIDISDQAIDTARSTAAKLAFDHCHFEPMDAERMSFGDSEFDLIFGRGIIHHLDLNKSFAEIKRVLRPGGNAVFFEPMGHNPAINRFRKKTPELRTPDEHPLLAKDFRLAQSHFRRVETEFFGLTTLGAVPFAGTSFGRGLMNACERTDRLLLRIPGLRRNAWFVLLTLTK